MLNLAQMSLCHLKAQPNMWQKPPGTSTTYWAGPSDESLPSKGPAQYVVEVPGGFCDRYGIGEGDIVEF